MKETWYDLLLKIGIKEENLETFATYCIKSGIDSKSTRHIDFLPLELVCFIKFQDRIKIEENSNKNETTITIKTNFSAEEGAASFEQLIRKLVEDHLELHFKNNEFLYLEKLFIFKLTFLCGDVELIIKHLI